MCHIVPTKYLLFCLSEKFVVSWLIDKGLITLGGLVTIWC